MTEKEDVQSEPDADAPWRSTLIKGFVKILNVPDVCKRLRENGADEHFILVLVCEFAIGDYILWSQLESGLIAKGIDANSLNLIRRLYHGDLPVEKL